MHLKQLFLNIYYFIWYLDIYYLIFLRKCENVFL